jgi:peptidoglycan hydrolase-like protein with peptidoglycan-binding domain
MTVYPTYVKDRKVTLDQIRASSTFRGMHPTMQERVAAMIEASGGSIGLGQGLRSTAAQLQMFLDRHVEDAGGSISFDGKRWRRLPDKAAAAPPGRSMHEIGLAADLVDPTGDFGWVAANAAKFDLKTFADVNNEPWHVQPAELPSGRSAYEQSKSWGMPPWPGAASKASSGASSAAGAATTMLTPAFNPKPGDSGPAVDVLIEAMIARALLPDADASRDGKYDESDRELVEDFQAESGLLVDGVVGPKTWGKLLQTVDPGDDGPHVRVLQVLLIRRGLMRDAAGNRDGVYGPATQQIVGQFQSSAGLAADHQVGPATWTALIGEKRRIAVVDRGDGAAPEGDAGVDELDDLDLLVVLDGMPAE